MRILNRAKNTTPNKRPGWFAVGFNRTELLCLRDLPDDPSVGSYATEVETFSDLDSPSTEWVALIEARLVGHFREAADDLVNQFYPDSTRSVAVLLAWAEPPREEVRDDGMVGSVICGVTVFREVMERHPECSLRSFCYRIVSTAADGNLQTDALVVRQLPLTAPRSPAVPPSIPAERPESGVIVAHRGRRLHLDTALRSIASWWGGPPRIRVGLDVDDPAEYEIFAGSHRNADFAAFHPVPVGPYVIRQYLAENTPEPIFIFHDSDDLSCSDRLIGQYAELVRTGCDCIGCHELRIDERMELLTAHRFPLDVRNALRERPGHACLHSTCILWRESFFRAGGLSTDQRVANDSQFLYRAYFKLRIRNADAFYYLRRRHSSSLTEHPQTGMSHPLRHELDRAWRADFEAVKKGRVRLEDSSLGQKVRTQPFSATPMLVYRNGDHQSLANSQMA